jgi:DNA-binding NarL/FixJ family response regulator
MIRLLLAEDHPVVRVGLERLLANADDIEVVGVAANGAEAIERTNELLPDIVLMDLAMPVLDGVKATREIVRAHDGSVSVVILTSFAGREQVIAALDAGASGYMLKDAEPDELLAAVRAAARGEAPLDPKAAREMLSARMQRPPGELSERELDVLRLVAAGRPNKLIARELEISEKTVKAHLTNVFQRIGVTDRTQAALWFREHVG